ncbi:hypothetical protein [Mycobacterium paraseoulense]|uniref:hypothetical protein n=1 Tax=Mycobacterium paraseoulense TaxID=590652 RepID=UPI0013019C69|nr:hypothetical protein [Mycobacterium paraseoulense]MCV7394201.1 hypothetical protein [Mycobacterium paraseoulense]
MAPVVGAKVIVLESHPAWISAQRHAAELVEAMRRHPSSMGRPAHRTPTRIRRPRP